MGRLVNGDRKITKPIPEHAGKLLIFCEGSTEYNYMDYFKKYLENNKKIKYTDVVLEPINTEGNARHVFQYAEEFLADEQNARKYALYEKHLIFDCDAPDDIQEVISDMIGSSNDFILDYSNLVFEIWLVMHFQEMTVDSRKTKAQVYSTMRDYLKVENYGSKEKAATGTIAALLGNDGDDKIRAAIVNAKELETYWKEAGKNYQKDIETMNPSVSIHSLVERLLDEIEYLCL